METVGISFCFLLLLLFDINDVRWKKPLGRGLFFIGMGGIIGISARSVYLAVGQVFFLKVSSWIFIACSFFFLVVLIYTLFFAIPAEEAYGDTTIGNSRRMACTTGMYALSRHPGVLWMALLYLCLYGALPVQEMLLLFLSTTICNVSYVIVQDVWTFPKLFCNYGEYKKETPFLFPTANSIKKCIYTWKQSKGQGGGE